jgi:hypothetical protein
MLDVDNDESQQFHAAVSALSHEWATSNQQFAIWLHASRKAKLVRCVPIPNAYRKTKFVFTSDSPSSELMFEFETGDPHVSIHQFFSAQYHVRRLVGQALAAPINPLPQGNSHDNSRPSR